MIAGKARHPICRFGVVVGLIGAGLFGALPARATIIFTVLNSVAYYNSVGNSFDVILTNTGPSPQNIAAFNFQISVSDPDIAFDDGNTDEATVSPYIFFPGDSFDVNNGFSLAILGGNSQTLLASDLSDSGAGTDMGAGDIVGLAHVFYNVSGTNAAGVFTVTLAPASPETSLADSNAAAVAFTTVDGTITILTPEPSTLLLFLATLPILFLVLRKRSVYR